MRFKIDELAAVVRGGHSKIFAMIHAYLDESGVHGDARVCAVCGYFGGHGQWRQFEKLWRECLADFGVPLEEFHAKDFVRRKGFFHRWDDSRHERFSRAIALAITTHKVYPVSFGIVAADFLSYPERERRFLTGATVGPDGTMLTHGCPTKPYFVPFQHCVRTIASHAEVGGKAHFYFGLDDMFARSALIRFAYIKKLPSAPFCDRLGDISFPLAKETPLLQAADLFSFLTYEHMLERLPDGNWGNPYPTRPILNAVLQRRQVQEDTVVFDKTCLAHYIAQVVPWNAKPAPAT